MADPAGNAHSSTFDVRVFGDIEKLHAEKLSFLKANDSYGYKCTDSETLAGARPIDSIRNHEFQRLHGQVYLDHAGAALYSEDQLDAGMAELKQKLFCNPHSAGVSWSESAVAEEELRRWTLDACNASSSEYEVVLTSGASAALKMVAEYFPWSSDSTLAYTVENHNSVLGMREYALNAGACAQPVDVTEAKAGQYNAGACAQPVDVTEAKAGQYNAGACAQPVDVTEAKAGQYNAGACAQPVDVTEAKAGQYNAGACAQPVDVTEAKAGQYNAGACAQPVDVTDANAGQYNAGSCAQPVDLSPTDAKAGQSNGNGLIGSTASADAFKQEPATPNFWSKYKFEPCSPPMRRHPPSNSKPVSEKSFSLFAFPLECNFSGVRFPMQLVDQVHSEGLSQLGSLPPKQHEWLVILDAAKGAATSPPDLKTYPADFVALSFYKIFGFPTGLGALVVRKDALSLLQKQYFSGGTVMVSYDLGMLLLKMAPSPSPPLSLRDMASTSYPD
eukprot:gene1441-32815_t